MIRNKVVFLCVFLIWGVIPPALADIQQDFKEANEHFSLHGKPIHPGLVQQFMSWLSDPGEPTTISVDVAAEHPNQYDDADVEISNKNICTKPSKDGDYFCYEWLGKLANGLHVLSIAASGGGSGIFEDLVFVRFDVGDGINLDGNKYKRLLMTVVREYGLGDRDDGRIQVLPDRVIVGKSQSRDKDVAVTFSN